MTSGNNFAPLKQRMAHARQCAVQLRRELAVVKPERWEE